LWREKPELHSHKFEPLRLVRLLTNPPNPPINVNDIILFTRSGYKRAVFFFPFGDRQVEEYIEVPDATTPGIVKDVSFKYCGEKLVRSSEYDSWVETVPEQFRDRCQRSEKGVVVQICCDALQLAAMGHLDHLFLSTNDSDFIPLCERLKDFGANISLVRLTGRPVNSDLVRACDSYHVVPDQLLNGLFGLANL
jgi:uncharacterized LabA/DUF88 family protein